MRRLGAGAALWAVVLVGCGSAMTPEEQVDHPLDAYRAVLDRRFDRDTQAQDLVFEETLAACMAEAGFEYRPQTDAVVTWTVIPLEALSVEFAEDFGYGLATEAAGPGEHPPMWPDPLDSPTMQWNREYRDSLSPDAYRAYRLAMSGEVATFDASTDWESIDWDILDQGCTGRAVDAAYSDVRTPEALTVVEDAVGSLYERIPEAPEVVATLPAWTSCMAAAGHPGPASPTDAEESVWDIWQQWQDVYSPLSPSNLGVTDYDLVRAEMPEALAELRAAEISLAAADATCRVESGFTAATIEARGRLEQEILDTYRTELQAYVDWILDGLADQE